MDINEIRAKTAVVGLAETGCGLAPGWNAMELMATAVYDALDDAGLSIQEVDGLFAATAFHSMAAMSLSEYLGIRPKFADGSNIGGSSFLAHILTAAMALDAGLTFPQQLGGIIGFKGHVIKRTLNDFQSEQNVWVCHGIN